MFAVTFHIGNKLLGDALEALAPYKIEELDVKPVVRAGAKGKAGGVPAWQVVGDFVQKAKRPVQAKEVATALEAAGFNRSGVSMHLRKAAEAKLIRKTAKGYVNGGAK